MPEKKPKPQQDHNRLHISLTCKHCIWVVFFTGVCVLGLFVFLKKYLSYFVPYLFAHILSLRVPKVILIVKTRIILSPPICRQYFIPKIGMQNDMVGSIKIKSRQIVEFQLVSSKASY